MIIMRTIDLYAAASKAMILSQRCDYLACVQVGKTFLLLQCKDVMQLVEEIKQGEKIFSIVVGTGKVLKRDPELIIWWNNQIKIFNATIKPN